MKNVVHSLRKTNTSKQVVMFPFGGGSGYSFIGLLQDIPPDIEILVINPPAPIIFS